MMRALITGGAGFIGSYLAGELLTRGHMVTVFDNLSTGDLRNIEHLKEDGHFRCEIGDILVREQLAPLVKDAEIVYHLAASVGVRYIMEHQVETLEINVKGTENVLELARGYGVKVILASTSEVYGKNSKFPYSEEDNLVLGSTTIIRWGYACSKACDEFLAMAYYREKGLSVVILRLFNTIGPRQTGRYGMVVPKFVAQALRGEPITVYGDGQQQRSFTYVKDVVKAMTDIAAVPAAEGGIFNVGNNQEITINALAHLIKQVTGSRSKIIHVPYEQVYGEHFEDIRRRLPDISKIQRFIDYHPDTDLVRIIEEIAEDTKNRELQD